MTLVVVAGPLANKPLNGGGAWSRLTLVRGLLRLGIDVHFVEEVDEATCVDADGRPTSFAESVNLAFFRRAVGQLGLDDRASLVYAGGRQTAGASLDRLEELAAAADLLLNVSGHLQLERLRGRFRRSAYLDLDPGFTQLWASSGTGGSRLEGHDVYFTVGANIGSPRCSIPTGGIDWRPVRQHVLLDDWPVTGGDVERFTTVSSWRGPFGAVEANGRPYPLKVHQFRRFIDLPGQVGAPFELALDIHPDEVADIELLRAHGWRLADPRKVAGDPLSFRAYVQGSGAEFCVAQGVYVDTWSGWFSDRTVRYLASGKPALVQETGFADCYPSGLGLVPFGTPAEAREGAKRIVADYAAHAQAARALAEQYFDAEVVLARLLGEAGVA